MVSRKRRTGFRLQCFEDGNPIDTGEFRDLADTTSPNNIGNRCLEHNLITFEQSFINVRSSIRWITEIFVERLFHVP